MLDLFGFLFAMIVTAVPFVIVSVIVHLCNGNIDSWLVMFYMILLLIIAMAANKQ